VSRMQAKMQISACMLWPHWSVAIKADVPVQALMRGPQYMHVCQDKMATLDNCYTCSPPSARCVVIKIYWDTWISERSIAAM